MPPRKQPHTLRDIAMILVSSLIQDAALHVHRCHPKSRLRRLEAAHHLQRCLMPIIQPLMDELCALSLKSGRTLALRCAGDVLIETLLHERTRHVSYTCGAHGRGASLRWDFRLWEKVLKHCTNVIELDISGVACCVDDILKAVGAACHCLEVICIPGKKVTSEGLRHLGTVPKLRSIENSRRELMFTQLGHELSCVEYLLCSLPALQHMPCSCMGQVMLGLPDTISLLALTSCWETQPTSKIIQTMGTLCPKLQRLELGHSDVFDHAFDVSALTESALAIVSLQLDDFSYNAKLEGFFIEKGTFLTTLELIRLEDINTEEVRIIGRHCRNLECLTICLRLRYEDSPSSGRGAYRPPDMPEPIFEKLLQFTFEGVKRCDEVGMLLCLSQAKDISSIGFRTERYRCDDNARCCLRNGALEEVVCELTAVNTLDRLEKMSLFGCYTLSKHCIGFLYDLPNITLLELELNHNADVEEYLEGLINKIYHNNMDLHLVM